MVNEQEFLQYILSAIVLNPDQLEINRKVDTMGVLLSVRVSKEDMGRVIGRAGETVKSIRNLVKIIGSLNRSNVNLKIEEPVSSVDSQPELSI